MKYSTDIQSASNNPESLESLYQLAKQSNEEAEFRADLQDAFEKSPEQILLSAWKARFEHLPLPKTKRSVQWILALVLGIISGLLLWSISSDSLRFLGEVPYLVILWAPIATIPVLIYLAVISKKNYVYTAISCIGLIVASLYVLLISPGLSRYLNDYLILMVIQLPLLCWIGIGIALMGLRSSYTNRFAFLIKSIEVMIAAGLYLIFGMIFGMITLGLFSALDVLPPEFLIRLVATGGVGLITTIAVATMYDAQLSPETQDFSQGLSKFIFTLVRLLLPLAFIVLFIYIFVIPFNFMAPFKNRDLLIIYNVMQFAIIGLVIGATPFRLDELSPKFQLWLRRGIIAVVILALVVSLYALAAVVYRTANGEFTLNRVTIIGWNIINNIILGALAGMQLRKGTAAWNERLQRVFSKATTAYLVWSVILILVLPLIFR
jgi:hypothetical protein